VIYYFYDNELPKPPRGYMNQTTMKVAYATGLLQLIDDEPPVPSSIRLHKDLIYKETDEKTLKLDIYQPKNLQKKAPLLIFVHGGSWKKGDKDDYRRYLVDYAQKGYITATVAYRFSQEAIFPAAFDDVVCAIKWLKANAANYNIDTNNIALLGGSAGGHLVMMAGYHGTDANYTPECETIGDARVKAIVNLYGPADLTTDFAINHPTVHQFVGASYSEATKGLFQAISPIQYITEGDPPTLTFHGTIDEVVPIAQGDMLQEALQQKNIDSEYHRLDGWPHAMDLGQKINDYCQFHIDQFLEKHLDK
jgi:acetyl esterase/lipase